MCIRDRALNYGGRYDITNAVKQISRDIENHKLNSDDITAVSYTHLDVYKRQM